MVAGVYPLISLSDACLLSTSLGTQEKQVNRRILVPALKELIRVSNDYVSELYALLMVMGL